MSDPRFCPPDKRELCMWCSPEAIKQEKKKINDTRHRKE